MGLVLNALIGCVQRDLIRKDLDYGTVKNHQVAAGWRRLPKPSTPGARSIAPPGFPGFLAEQCSALRPNRAFGGDFRWDIGMAARVVMTLARTWFHFRPAPLTLSLSPWRGEGTGQRQSGCRLTYPVAVVPPKRLNF
jgi:hypothetical protein